MKSNLPDDADREDRTASDLVDRLEAYRRRIKSENRPRTLARLDAAIADAKRPQTRK